jgi:regulatory protein
VSNNLAVANNNEMVNGNGNTVESNCKNVGGNGEPVGDNREPVGGNDKPVGGNGEPVRGNEENVDSNSEAVTGNNEDVKANSNIVAYNHDYTNTRDKNKTIIYLKNQTQNKTYTLQEASQKLEHYCSYQERCHNEVVEKLRSMRMIPQAIDEIVVHLIQHNFLNEERFACAFARGKHRIKFWGKIRIVSELKFRNISKYNIDKALQEISAAEYAETFHKLAEHHWGTMRENNPLKKKKKFCDFMLRKGFENGLVYEKMKNLETSTP